MITEGAILIARPFRLASLVPVAKLSPIRNQINKQISRGNEKPIKSIDATNTYELSTHDKSALCYFFPIIYRNNTNSLARWKISILFVVQNRRVFLFGVTRLNFRRLIIYVIRTRSRPDDFRILFRIRWRKYREFTTKHIGAFISTATI